MSTAAAPRSSSERYDATTSTVAPLAPKRERLLSLDRSSLKESAFIEKSPMPSYKGQLSDTELTDLVAYLASLKEKK